MNDLTYQIKNCPCCGSEAFLEQSHYDIFTQHYNKAEIVCSKCGIKTPFMDDITYEDRKKLIDLWNNRVN